MALSEEQRAEKARIKFAEEQAKADWEKELARREAHRKLAEDQPSTIRKSVVGE